MLSEVLTQQQITLDVEFSEASDVTHSFFFLAKQHAISLIILVFFKNKNYETIHWAEGSLKKRAERKGKLEYLCLRRKSSEVNKKFADWAKDQRLFF